MALAAEVAADLDAARAIAADLRAVAAEPAFGEDPRLHAAFAYWATQYYGAVEGALVRLLRAIDGTPNEGFDWHAAVLARARLPVEDLRPAWIGSDTWAALDELRSFRHFLRHAYAVTLDARRLAERARGIERADALVDRDLRAAVAWLRT
jgi:hypothetical protein